LCGDSHKRLYEKSGSGLADHASSNGLVGKLIDENDAAGDTITTIAIVEHRLTDAHADTANLIQAQLLFILDLVERIDVHLIENDLHDLLYLACCVAKYVATSGIKGRLLGEPAQHHIQVLSHMGLVLRLHDHVAARDINLVLQSD